MRILQVRFKNLNSLVGEWEIDLTHPAFESDGIFAITGPTGAGKTTILDAICLALYGRTPRLNKVTKSGNEIMSRQTSACFAEVTFETQAGRFRCHWSQHRARKRPDGELQAPKHEIADADSGQIFETKLRGVAEQIETATGMDFERFTRSMLLAQGGFAAFLQAAPDERAPILEQITGTEIYSRISIRVHERRSAERKRLETLQAELAAIQLRTPAEERQLNASLAQKILQEADLNQQVTRQNQAIAWLDGIVRLERELGLVEGQKREWCARQEAFQPELERLARAQQALELAGAYAGLTALRHEQATDRQGHRECLQALPKQDGEVRRAEEALRLAVEKLAQEKTAQTETLAVIRQVRELDLRRRATDAPIKTAANVIAELEKSLADLRSRKEEDGRALRAQSNALAQVREHLAQTKADEALVEYLAGIRSRFDALSALNARRRAKVEELGTAETLKTAATRLWREQAAHLEARNSALGAEKGTLDHKQIELAKTLNGREIADWRNALAELKERKTRLEEVSDAVQLRTASRHALGECDTRLEILRAEQALLAQQLETQMEKAASCEREMRLLETQFSLLQKIQGFEEARQQLQDGEPCPLCGAKEHPFAAGNIPVPDETMAALNRVRAELKTANAAVSTLRVKQAETQKDRQQIGTQKKDCTDRLARAEARIHEGLSALAIEASGPDLAERLPQLQQANQDHLARASTVVQTAEGLASEIVTLRGSLEKTRDAAVQSERETQAAAHRKDSAEQAVDRTHRESEALAAQFQDAQEEVLREVLPFGFKTLSVDALDQVQLELTARRDRWLARQKEKTACEKQVASLEFQTQHQAEQINTAELALGKKQDALNALMREQDTLSHARRELFGDKSPDDEESRRSAAVETAERDRDAARQALNAAAQELGKLQSRAEGLEKSMAARSGRWKTLEEAFRVRLGALGFTDEAGYLAACLPEDERKHLMQQAQQLATAQTELEVKRRDTAARLETERCKQVTDQSRDQLDQGLDTLVNSLKELQQAMGGIRQKLTDNDNLRQQQQARAKTVDAQKRECARWDILHELIGSADGKKYRNFAQGLTFEMMIGHANRQLQKMTDRYLLIRDAAHPLELNVVDNYQAGEIRSTKNLSGGESFIVSLSLALGLSHMASKNVRVDSLFLDEGFGTLDEETLDTALEALAGLQQDGKLIGVISHVPALRERISTRIQVTPQTGGRSVIGGPGCGRSTHGADS